MNDSDEEKLDPGAEMSGDSESEAELDLEELLKVVIKRRKKRRSVPPPPPRNGALEVKRGWTQIENARKKMNMPKEMPSRVESSVSATGRLGSGSGPESKMTKAGLPVGEGSVGGAGRDPARPCQRTR